jgi:hypothetical protein
MRRGTWRGALALLATAVLPACARTAAARYGPEEQRREARTSADRMSAAVQERAFVGACGGTLAPEPPRAAVLVNARQALSCRDLGYLLRRLVPAQSPVAAPWVMVPAADTAAVCAFLRQEKVRLPVAAVTRGGEVLREARMIVMARMDAGREDTAYYAPTGRAVLLQYQQDPVNASAFASPATFNPGAR